jgi:hypothetical protein
MTPPVITTWSFESRWGPQFEWLTSCGRWDDSKDAAQKAAEWFLLCSENGWTSVEIRICQVQEIDYPSDPGVVP